MPGLARRARRRFRPSGGDESDESDDEPPAPTPAAAPSGALDLAEWSVRDLKKEMAAKGLSADGMVEGRVRRRDPPVREDRDLALAHQVQEAELAGDGGETHDVDATWATDRLGLLGLDDIVHDVVPQMLDANADEHDTRALVEAVVPEGDAREQFLMDFVDASVVEGRTIGEIASLYGRAARREALAKGEDTVASNDTRDPRDVYATLFKVHTTTLTRTMRTWKADLEAVAKLAVRADKLRLVEVLLEHGAPSRASVVGVPLYDAMEARRFGKYLRGLADDEKDNLIARPGDVERGFEDLDTLCGNIGGDGAAEAAAPRSRRATTPGAAAATGCGDVLSFVAAGQKKGGHIFANGDMPDGVKGLREAREALEKCASLAYQVAKEPAAAVGKENPLGFDGKALAHAFQLVALQRLTNVVALEASLLTATNPSREGVADVIPGYLDAGGASASWLDAWLKAVKGNEAKSAARVATALATAVSKWRESAPRLRDLVAAADEGSEQTLSSWKSAAKLKDFRPAKLAVAVAARRGAAQKELADQAKREEAAAKERAARADRERKREEGRATRRKLGTTPRALAAAQTALAEVKARDLELKLKALPWATLVKRYGISVDEDELSGYERPDGAPAAGRRAGRGGRARPTAARWPADRALDGSMLLLYSAFKDASGAVGVLAWCAVRKANLNDFVEKILESLDRRAGVSEDEAPFLTLRADHVLLSPGKNTPMKLYVAACESLPGGRAPGAVKAAVGENRWRPDLRLTEKEAGAVADDGAPSMVLGRSGTGKTVCMARRIARDRADHADRELLFVARSQALCNFVRRGVRGDADARAAGEPRAAAKFLTVNDLLPLLEEKTKNMAAGCKSDVRTPWRRMRYYRRVDGVDFRRDRDLRLTDEDYAKANGNYSSENDTDSSDDDSSDDDDGAGGARATQFGAMSFKVRGSCWPAADLVDFSRFRDEFWDKCGAERSRKNESLSPTFCWVQIQSFIKGSVTPLIRGEPLERDEYIDESGAISKRRATGLSKQDREDCYDVFVSYERELRHRQCHRRLWDATDREVALIQRVLEEGFVATTPLEASKRDGGAMAILDHVYCDEVQDMTQATLAVLLLAVGNRPERLFVCGDTAQAIQDGVAFRFSDLKETIYELQKEVKTRSGRGAAAMAAASDRSGAAAASKKLFKLTNNYRTHAGILGAANAVLDLLEQAFPNSVDVMEKDAGVSTGPRPTFSHERPVLDDLPNATLLMRAEPLRDARRRLAAERDDRRALVEEREGAVGASDDRDAVLDRADAALKAAAADIADEAEEAAAAWHAEVKAARKAYDAKPSAATLTRRSGAKRDAWLADRDKQAKKAKADLAKLAKKRALRGRRRRRGRGAARTGGRGARGASAEQVYNQRAREALDLWNTPSPMDANKHRVVATAVVGGDAARVQGIVAGLVAEEVEADVLLGDMEEEDIADCIAPDPAAAQIRALIVRRAARALATRAHRRLRALTPAAEASVAPLEHFVAVEQRANADRCAAEDFDAQEAALGRCRRREPPADLDEPDLPALVKPTEDHSPAGRAAYKAEYVRARATAPTPRSSASTRPRSPRAKRRKKASKAAERADAGAIDAEIRRRRAAAGLTPSALHCAELLDNKLVSTRVFSVQEFKGLEEEAVVLVDFFGSADKETAKAWRDLFKARREGRGDFSDLSRRRALERDLKLLYTALTRPRSRLHKRSTKEKKKSADGATLSADEWRSRGALIARVATERAEGDAGSPLATLTRLGEARDCFRNAEDAELEHRCDAVIACAKAVKDVRAKVADARGRDKGDRDDDDDAKPSAARRPRRRPALDDLAGDIKTPGTRSAS
ncbi:manganese ion binding protein [Aureococcus anophagefferens]|nr:manganese ion binding protein [Aureococcus anophagefferens]